MSNGEFFEWDEESGNRDDREALIKEVYQLYNEGRIEESSYNEEQYEFLIEYFLGELEEEIVLELSHIAYNRHPYSQEFLIRHLESLLATSEIERAAELLDEKLPLNPTSSELHLIRARVLIREENYREAEAASEEMLLYLFDEERVEMALMITQDYIELGRYREALQLLQRVEQHHPKERELLNEIAFCYERLGEHHLSVDYYQRYLDIDPFNENVWFNVGTIHARGSNYQEAMEAFLYALALNSGHSSALYNKGLLELTQGYYQEAIETFSSFLTHEPDNSVALIALGDAYRGVGELKEGEKSYLKVLEVESNHLEASAGMVAIKLEERLYREALSYLPAAFSSLQIHFPELQEPLIEAYNSSGDANFLLYYTLSLYLDNKRELFNYWLVKLTTLDKRWIKKLIKLAPELKEVINPKREV